MKLLHGAFSEAARMGAERMVIEADPDAAPFYRPMAPVPPLRGAKT